MPELEVLGEPDEEPFVPGAGMIVVACSDIEWLTEDELLAKLCVESLPPWVEGEELEMPTCGPMTNAPLGAGRGKGMERMKGS